jgi:uncharacterized protein
MDRVLIAAASGRALAASARRAGYAPLVADVFGDDDAVGLAAAHAHLGKESMRDIGETELITAIDTLAAAGDEPLGVVWGTGFEDRPDLLALLAQRRRLLGNGAEIVARLKDPLQFARLCAACGIAHPEISLSRPRDAAGWLVKRRGGSGGSHIRFAADVREPAANSYYQRRHSGAPVSLLFLADGRRVMPLGFSAQWGWPTRSQPFRYGGAVRPAMLSTGIARQLSAAVERMASRISLRGLNSADFLVEDDAFCLLEINPRPGATLDIFKPPEGSLLKLHIDACEGQLPRAAPEYAGAAAAAVVHAAGTFHVVPRDWPEWTADRPRAGTLVQAGAPLCTVFAQAGTAADAKRLVHQRHARILASIEARAA